MISHVFKYQDGGELQNAIETHGMEFSLGDLDAGYTDRLVHGLFDQGSGPKWDVETYAPGHFDAWFDGGRRLDDWSTVRVKVLSIKTGPGLSGPVYTYKVLVRVPDGATWEEEEHG